MPIVRTLFISPMLPVISGDEAGGKHRRARLFLRALASVSKSLEIIYIVPPRYMDLAEDRAYLARTQSEFWGIDLTVSLLPRMERQESLWNHYGRGVLDAAAQPKLYPFAGLALSEQVGRRLDEKPDCVFVERIEGMLPVLRSRRQPGKLLFDIDDLYHKVQWRELRQERWGRRQIALALHLPSLLRAEHHAVSSAATTFTCSEVDQTALRRLGIRAPIEVVPNAIVPPDSPPSIASVPTVLFLGPWHHKPNRFAAERLIRRIWPLIRAEYPAARLLIAGRLEDSQSKTAPVAPGVEYLGFVEDIAGLYAQSRVVCTPIAHGSGTRLKLIEAAAYARPIVSTRIGAEGLLFKDGIDILLRESDADIATACVALLRDAMLCDRLGAAARASMLSHYDARRVESSAAGMIRRAVFGRNPEVA